MVLCQDLLSDFHKFLVPARISLLPSLRHFLQLIAYCLASWYHLPERNSGRTVGTFQPIQEETTERRARHQKTAIVKHYIPSRSHYCCFKFGGDSSGRGILRGTVPPHTYQEWRPWPYATSYRHLRVYLFNRHKRIPIVHLPRYA